MSLVGGRGVYFNNRHVAYNFGLLNFVCGLLDGDDDDDTQRSWSTRREWEA